MGPRAALLRSGSGSGGREGQGALPPKTRMLVTFVLLRSHLARREVFHGGGRARVPSPVEGRMRPSSLRSRPGAGTGC